MNTQTKLEAALVWDGAGHLAEGAVAALVDGELELLPDDAVEHAGHCARCAERVGSAALLAVDIADALAAREPAPARAPLPARAVAARRPIPWAALAAAFAIACAGLVPSLRELPALAMRLPAVVFHTLPVYARGMELAVSHAQDHGLLFKAWLATAVLLVAAGLFIAWLAPRSMSYRRAA